MVGGIAVDVVRFAPALIVVADTLSSPVDAAVEFSVGVSCLTRISGASVEFTALPFSASASHGAVVSLTLPEVLEKFECVQLPPPEAGGAVLGASVVVYVVDVVLVVGGVSSFGMTLIAAFGKQSSTSANE